MNFKQTDKEGNGGFQGIQSANQYTVIFVKPLLFGSIMSFQHNNTNTNETETSKQKKRKADNRPHYIYFTFNCRNWSSGVTGMKLVIGEDRFCDGNNCLRLS
jgi:membrane protein insertase Oxa1/YidC/SpoIIIJ